MIPAVLTDVVRLLKHDRELVRKKAVMVLHRMNQLDPDVRYGDGGGGGERRRGEAEGIGVYMVERGGVGGREDRRRGKKPGKYASWVVQRVHVPAIHEALGDKTWSTNDSAGARGSCADGQPRILIRLYRAIFRPSGQARTLQN